MGYWEKRLIHNLKVLPKRLLLNYRWKCTSLKWGNLMVNTLNKWSHSLLNNGVNRHNFSWCDAKISVGLPWWRSGWESACQCRGHGFEPWSGKIPRAAGQLGPWTTTTEPARLEPVLHNKRGHDGERPAHRDEEWPPLAATGESPRTETKTQHSQQ